VGRITSAHRDGAFSARVSACGNAIEFTRLRSEKTFECTLLIGACDLAPGLEALPDAIPFHMLVVSHNKPVHVAEGLASLAPSLSPHVQAGKPSFRHRSFHDRAFSNDLPFARSRIRLVTLVGDRRDEQNN